MKLDNLKIGTRLYASFAVVMLFMAAIAIIGAWRLSELYDSSQYTIDRIFPRASDSQQIAYLSMDNTRLLRNVILNKTPGAFDKSKAQMDSNRAEIKELLASLDRLVSTDEGRKLLHNIEEARGPFLEYMDEVISLASKGDDEGATKVLYGPKYQTQGTYLAALHDMVEYQKKVMIDGGKRLMRCTRKRSLP